MRRKVVISQIRIPHYRLPLFERMRSMALEADIDLHVVHGFSSRAEESKRDEAALGWGTRVTNRYLRFSGTDIVWQPVPSELRDADLHVMVQENRILSNYPLLLSRRLHGRKVAYWGHGANFQSKTPGNLRERWKRFLVDKVDHWFAYTQLTVDHLAGAGVEADRITCLNNAIDTTRLRAQCDSVTPADIARLTTELGLGVGAPLGLFCGSLYPEKRLDLLVAAGDLIVRKVPDFQLVVIGAGPSEGELRSAAATRPWLRLVGTRHGMEKAILFRAARVMLNPGLLGLHILDSFAGGLPLVSTRNARHSPEIVYLEDGVNGLLTGDSVEEYAAGVVQILSDAPFAARLAEQARNASHLYTVEEMARRFMGGIQKCLGR